MFCLNGPRNGLLLVCISLVSIVNCETCEQDSGSYCVCTFNNGSKINLTSIAEEGGPRFVVNMQLVCVHKFAYDLHAAMHHG